MASSKRLRRPSNEHETDSSDEESIPTRHGGFQQPNDNFQEGCHWMRSPADLPQFENLSLKEAKQTVRVEDSVDSNQRGEMEEDEEEKKKKKEEEDAESALLREAAAASVPPPGETLKYQELHRLFMTGTKGLEEAVKMKGEYDAMVVAADEVEEKPLHNDDVYVVTGGPIFGPSKKKSKSSGRGDKTNGYCLFLQNKAKEAGVSGKMTELIRRFDGDWKLLTKEEKQEWKDRAKNGGKVPDKGEEKKKGESSRGKPKSSALPPGAGCQLPAVEEDSDEGY